MKVAVAGAGVAGLVGAVIFAEAGHEVVVHEKAERLGADAASWLAGGMLAPFCEAESAPPEIVEPGLAGIAWWAERTSSFRKAGTLVVAPWRDRVDLSRFGRRTSAHDRIGPDAISKLEPALSGRFGEALHFAEEAHLDPRAALLHLRDRLEALGGRMELGSKVEPGELDATCVLDARGVAAPLPGLRPVRGEMLYLRTEEIGLSRPVRLLHPRSPIYVVPRGEGLFMVGATMVESADRRGATLRGTVELLNAAYALHPAFAEAELVETAAGLRPSYDDNLPRASREGRIVSMNGLYRHGFLLAPHVGLRALALAEEGHEMRMAS